MPDFLKVYSLGDKGVNRVRTPLHLEDDELVVAQNAEVERRGAQHSITKRPGMTDFTEVLDALGVFAVVSGGLGSTGDPPGPTDDPDGPPPRRDVKSLLLDLVYMRCRLYLSAATTSIADNTASVVTWTAEEYDVGNLHDLVTDPEKITIPTAGDGLYLVVGQVKWATSASAKKRGVRIYKNGTGLQFAHDGAADDDGDGMTQQVVGIIPLVATDYLTMEVEQDTGGALNALGGTIDETSLVVIRIVQTVSTPLPRCHAYKTGDQTLTDGVAAIVALDAEALDNASMHDNAVNNSRITIPSGHDGHYSCVGHFGMAHPFVGRIEVEILKNGTQVLAKTKLPFINSAEAPDTTGQVVGTFDMVAGDYFELRATYRANAGVPATNDLLGGSIYETGLVVARVA